MRHKKGNAKLSKPTDQRIALIRSQVCALFKHNRITTTVVRAKEVRRQVDRVITLAKKNDLSAKRQILAFVRDKAVARQVWSNTARFVKRNSGYTRIMKIGPRGGDAAPMVFLELVDIGA